MEIECPRLWDSTRAGPRPGMSTSAGTMDAPGTGMDEGRANLLEVGLPDFAASEPRSFPTRYADPSTVPPQR